MTSVKQSHHPHRFNATLVLWSFLLASSVHGSKEKFSLLGRNLQHNITREDYRVTWNMNLGGKDSLLESAFLKAGFERSVKNYLNKEVECDDMLNLTNASFYSVEIVTNSEGSLSAVGKCVGDRASCKRGLNQSYSSTEIYSAIHAEDDSCATFKNSTIFDLFQETTMTEFTFHYNVDVDVNCELDGSLGMDYNVIFQSANHQGLDEIKSIVLEPEEPEAVTTYCTTSQCVTQRSAMHHIFRELGMPIEGDKYECLYYGINCDSNGFVTQISLGKYFDHQII